MRCELRAQRPDGAAGGMSTVSITWITPFEAPTSAAVTCAPFTYTLPPRTCTSSGSPFTVAGFALPAPITSAAITFPGTTW